MESEDVTELLKFHPKTLTLRSNSYERNKCFIKTESNHDEDTVNTVELTTKDLDYYINIDDKAEAQFATTRHNFKESHTSINSYPIMQLPCDRYFVKGSVN